MKQSYSSTFLVVGILGLLTYGWYHSAPPDSLVHGPLTTEADSDGSIDPGESRDPRFVRAGISRGNGIGDQQRDYVEASLYLEANDWDEAIRCLEDLVRRERGLTAAWVDLGYASLKRGKVGDYARALEASSQALDLNPEAFEAWYNLACAKAKLKDESGAMEALERAHSIDAGRLRAMASTDPDLETVRASQRFKALD